MNKYFLAIGALAALGTACVKDPGACDTSDSVCEETGETGTTGCGDYTGAFALGIDSAACSAPTLDADGYVVADGSGTAVTGDSVSYGCDEVGYFFDVFTLGWASDVEINIYQDLENGWEESGIHTAVEIMAGSATNSFQVYDAEGWWDYYYLELNNTTDFNAVDAENTLFVCGDSRIQTLDFYLVATSEDGSATDCVQWGEAGSGYYDSKAGSCSTWN